MLFARDLGNHDEQTTLAALLAARPAAGRLVQFARDLADGAWARRADVDRVLGSYSRGWSVDRMASVDRNILRLAVYEILYRPEVPSRVAVAEAVQVAKRYGSADSGRFINGVLGAILDDLPPAGGEPQ